MQLYLTLLSGSVGPFIGRSYLFLMPVFFGLSFLSTQICIRLFGLYSTGNRYLIIAETSSSARYF